jgi:transcription initiation factor IIE alpha subunit
MRRVRGQGVRGMSERYQHLRRLGRVMESAKATYEEALHTLIDALPENHARAYRACRGRNDITSNYLMEQSGWSQNQSADTLRELWEIGLIQRREVVDDNGRHYEYGVTP